MSIKKDQVGQITKNADGTWTQTNIIDGERETYTVDEANGTVHAVYEDGTTESFTIVDQGTEGAIETAQGVWGIHSGD